MFCKLDKNLGQSFSNIRIFYAWVLGMKKDMLDIKTKVAYSYEVSPNEKSP